MRYHMMEKSRVVHHSKSGLPLSANKMVRPYSGPRDGVRIAKRGDPGTPEAKTWVQLVPGYTVRDNANLTDFIIEVDGVRVH